MNAWEIKQEILNCVVTDDGTTVSGLTGEILDEEALNKLQMSLEEKERNIALWIKNLELDIDGYKKIIDSFKSRKERDEKLKERLSDYLFDLLDGEKKKTVEYEVTYRKSKAVRILDESKIPKEYFKPQPSKISLTDISKALKEGKEVEGAELEERVSMKVK